MLIGVVLMEKYVIIVLWIIILFNSIERYYLYSKIEKLETKTNKVEYDVFE